MRWCALAFLLAACSVPSVPMDGKRCGPGRGCPEGLPCNPYTAVCTAAPGCPLFAETQPTCGRRDLYLAPSGSDAGDGTDASRPRASLSGLPLRPGDRVHLAAGSYANPMGIDGRGASGCPIVVSGAPGFASILKQPVDLVSASFLELRDLAFEVDAFDHALLVEDSVQITVRSVRFTSTGTSLAGGPFNAILFHGGGCGSCSVLESHFDQTRAHVLFANGASSGLQFRGNRVSTAPLDFALQVDGSGARIEGNDFFGSARQYVVQFRNAAAGNGAVRRNVFHDLASAELTVVSGAGEVRSNSFVRLSAGVAASGTAFRNNLLLQCATGLARAPSAGDGYNLFDRVQTPYFGSTVLAATDRLGTASLGDDFAPRSGSEAIDSADPSLPVPPFGGDRADIGARESDATLLPDGRYCLDDP